MLSKLSWLLIAFAVLYALFVQSVFPRYVVDDAYITFRYAENLALHGELNWNVGEDPVEGYTGVALPVLLSGFIQAGVSPISASRGIGIFSFWLGFIMLYLLVRRIRLHPLGVSSLLLLYATLPVFFTHTFSGMETMLFLALMFSSLYAAVSGKDKSLALFLLLTSLTRPEGVAFSLIILGLVAFVRYKESREAGKRFLLSTASIYALPAVLYFVWRFSYYGHLLPNTFYAKTEGDFTLYTVVDIARFIRRYIAVPLLGLLLLAGAETDALVPTLRRWHKERRALLYVLGGAVFCAAVVWVLANAHLIANFAHRFYVPLLPVAFVFLAFGWKLGFDALEPSRKTMPKRYAFVLSAFLLLVLYQSAFQMVKVREEIAFADEQIILHEDVHNAVGKELGAILAPQETVIVYVDAGAIPYFSKLRAIDFGNLNDELLATGGLSPKERLDYFFGQKAAALSFSSTDTEKVSYGEEAAAIVSDQRFGDYRLYKRYIPREQKLVYYQLVYLRKDVYDAITPNTGARP